MSRIALVMTAFISGPAIGSPFASTFDRYHQMTDVAVRCSTPHSGNDISVCGRRRADRWRVPFIGYDAGDPHHESVETERKRISAAPRVPCGKGAIIADCGGGVGVKATIGVGPGGQSLRLRPLAD